MLAIRNALIHTGTGETISGGSILMRDGRILDVGGGLDIPSEADILDAAGAYLTPGLVEAHGHVGLADEGVGWEGDDVNERVDPVTPHVSALDGINPRDRGFEDFLAGGITSVQIKPGSANVLGGSTVAAKTGMQATADRMIINPNTGMKAALGENPKRAHGAEHNRAPYTRMGSAAIMRDWLFRAREYLKKREQKDPKVGYDAKLEALLPVVRGEVPLRIHCHRADDMLTAIRIAEELDVLYTLEHATAGFKIAGYLAARGVRCAVGPSMSREAKVELEGVGFETAAAFEKHGVPYCLTTDHPVVRAMYLHMIAGKASAAGVGDEGALASVTLRAAEHVGIADRVGSLETGKDADMVIWNGDPLDGRSTPRAVIIDGEIVHRGR